MEYLQYLLIFASAFGGFYFGTLFAKVKLVHDPRVLSLIKRQTEQELELANIRELQDRVLASHKSLQARVGMDRARRAKKAAEEVESDFEVAQRFRPGHLPQ